MKLNRHLLIAAVVLLASGSHDLLAGDPAGNKTVTASFADTSDVLRYINDQDDPAAGAAPKQSADAAGASASRTDTSTPVSSSFVGAAGCGKIRPTRWSLMVASRPESRHMS